MTRAPLNVVQLYHDCGPGGAEQMIVDLCSWLDADGHRVSLVTCREGWLAERLRERRIETIVMPTRRLLDVRGMAEVIRVARARKADVLHSHEFPMAVGMAPASFLTRLPLVATVHGRELLAARRVRRTALALTSRLCRRVVAVSKAIEGFLTHDVGVPRSKVTTIYNGIDLDRYQVNGASQKLRHELGIGERTRVVGTVGSLYPVKGQTYLLGAMAAVVKRAPDTVCLIAGRGELRPELEREAAERGVADRVRFLGYRSDVPALLGLFDVFVLPSLSEGLPLSLLEAQAAGKPVVASRVGGSPEVVVDGDTGYLVPPAAPDALAERISRLLEDREHAEAMGRRGRQRVEGSFSLAAMARAYLDLYREYAGRARGAA